MLIICHLCLNQDIGAVNSRVSWYCNQGNSVTYCIKVCWYRKRGDKMPSELVIGYTTIDEDTILEEFKDDFMILQKLLLI